MPTREHTGDEFEFDDGFVEMTEEEARALGIDDATEEDLAAVEDAGRAG